MNMMIIMGIMLTQSRHSEDSYTSSSRQQALLAEAAADSRKRSKSQANAAVPASPTPVKKKNYAALQSSIASPDIGQWGARHDEASPTVSTTPFSTQSAPSPLSNRPRLHLGAGATAVTMTETAAAVATRQSTSSQSSTAAARALFDRETSITSTDAQPVAAADAMAKRKSASISSQAPTEAEDLPAVVFTERWKDKERRLRARSSIGRVSGWRLLPVIVKSGDDLRQEQCAAQLIRQMHTVLIEAGVDCWLRPYDIIALSPNSGLIEAVADTVSLDALHRRDAQYTTLLSFFERFFGPSDSVPFERARDKFVRSLAGYCIVCYLLQIKDRHNGNILLDTKGHIIHIDFGFLLGK